MYFFVVVLIIFIIAKIFSKEFRNTECNNINFFKLNYDSDNVPDTNTEDLTEKSM